MKKFLLVVLAMVMLGSVQAQTSFKNKVEGLTGTEFYFGPKFGFNVASISDGLNKSKFSFHLGAFAEFKFNDLFGLQTELIYSRQGDKGKSGGMKTWARVNYLNIPVLAKFYVWEGVSVDLGPQLGFALNGKNKTKSGGTEVKTDIDHLNTVDLSFAMGLSYDFNMGLVVSARYNLGLTNVIEKDKFGGNNQNRVFQLSAGWKF